MSLPSGSRRLMTQTIHIHPTAELAERVLLPGDPGRALLLAQSLLEAPRMFNHNRGLWGYTGIATDGQLLTIQSTGMGGPSAAIVAAELAELGAGRLVRVETCGALDPALELGDLLIAPESLARDGTSRALGAADRVGASPELVAALVAAAGGTVRCGPVVSTDLFYEVDQRREQDWITAGALAVEMEAATLFAFARTRGLQAAAALIVSDLLVPERRRIGVEELRAAEQRLGDVVLGALRD
ncbi:MAG: phosphorylase family protein [Solirubrobacteraceae bacterium]